MAPKKISVNKRTKKISNEDGFKGLLGREKVLCLVDEDGVDIEDFESLEDGSTYTLGPRILQQEQKSQVPHFSDTARVGLEVPEPSNLKAMESFFSQNISKLELDADGHLRVSRMEWFDVQISLVYWRQCFSYILCSTIAFFEKVHEDYVAATVDQVRRYNSMVITGVQGTGKSILGAFIGLFMAKVFGWRVHYRWKNGDFEFGIANPPTRVIHIVDLSQGKPNVYPSGFVLIISSANKDRWSDIGQQQSWTEHDGNFCFIDPASEKEVRAMAAKLEGAREARTSASEALKAFKVVGGVPRLCLLSSSKKAVEKVDGALAVYTIKQAVQNLQTLTDATTNSSIAEVKVYPGLVAHFVPTNSFRNKFEIQAASPYIGKRLAEKQKEYSDASPQKLMRELLDMPKARGFAGWIWEPMLSQKMRGSDSHISIVGSELPVTPQNPPIHVLLQVNASDVEYITFGSMADFEAKAGNYSNKRSLHVFAKATSDSFAAIDAIMIVREGDRFVIAALQLTVAEKYHSVVQSMIIKFVETCSRIYDGSAEPQLWFLQPEQCLSYFGFVNLQSMEFDEITFPSTPSAASTTQTEDASTRKSKRIRCPTVRYGNWAPITQTNGRQKSNNKDYWDERVQSLKQFVGIVRIDQNTTVRKEEDSIRSMFAKVLKDLEDRNDARADVFEDPQLRSWTATTDVMKTLNSHAHKSLMDAIERDIALDKQRLEAAGVPIQSLKHL